MAQESSKGVINIRTDVKIITLNVSGTDDILRLNNFMSTEPPPRTEGEIQQRFKKVQLWENERTVSPKIFEKAMVPNNYRLATVLYNDTGSKYDTRLRRHVQVFKTKIVFKTVDHLQNDADAVKMDFTDAQREEVSRILGRTYTFCHAQWFEGPIPNIQIALMFPIDQKALLHLTVRDGVLRTTLAKDLSAEEIQQSTASRFINRLVRSNV